MSATSGVLDGIACSATSSSDQELSSPFSSDGKDTPVRKGCSNSRVHKRRSVKKMECQIKDLQSLGSYYQQNEAVLVSSTNALSSEIMGYEIQIAGLHGKMKSIVDENNVLRRRDAVLLSPRDEERSCEERAVLVDLKKEVCNKIRNCNGIQDTVNAKLDELHEFYEKYYEGIEVNFANNVFEGEAASELAKVKQELKSVRKNSQIKVENLQIQLIQANQSLRVLKREISAKDDCLKGIPELVQKTNNAFLSYKKNIANQKETIEALQAELFQQLETRTQTEMQLQTQTPTNVTLVDPFDDNDPKELLAVQERELQELRLQKKVSDERSRTTQLHLERQNNTIKLLQGYIQSLLQRQPPQQHERHLHPSPVEYQTPKFSDEKSPELNAPRSVLLLPQHAGQPEVDSDSQGLLKASPHEQLLPEKKLLLAPKLNLDHIPRPSYFSKQRPPRILDMNSLTLILPKAPNATHTDPLQTTHDHQPLPDKKPQENIKKAGCPSKFVTAESITSTTSSSRSGTPTSPEVLTPKLHK